MGMTRFGATVFAATLAAMTGMAHADDGDATKGKKIFKKCQACHKFDRKSGMLVDKNGVGPHLAGLFGRDVAAIEEFKYSKAMVEWGEDKTWTVEQFAEYIAAPKKVVKGTKMAFAGLRKEQQIADLIAFLKEAGAVAE